MTKAKKMVAVVTPHPAHMFPLSDDQNVSLRHLRQYLGNYDRYLLGVETLPVGFADFQLTRFPARHFSSIRNYSKLLVSPQFYRVFENYEYILIYQFDCLVFSSDLERWCQCGWDYIGAPWFTGFSLNPDAGFWKVGNGGLSLRKVDSALKVLTSGRLCESPQKLGARTRFGGAPYPIRSAIQCLKTKMHSMGYKNTVGYFTEEMARETVFHEDMFWSLFAQRFAPDFAIPLPDEAVRFSYECAPRYCYKVTNGQLPFGCHAWARYDRQFWEPFLLKQGVHN